MWISKSDLVDVIFAWLLIIHNGYGVIFWREVSLLHVCFSHDHSIYISKKVTLVRSQFVYLNFIKKNKEIQQAD